MNSVGTRLRQARIARGLTQEQLARGLATKGFISQVERDHATPSLAKLRLIADRLGLPLGHFTDEQSMVALTYLRKAAELAVKAKEPGRALQLADEGLALALTANERADLFRIKGRAFDDLRQLEEAVHAHQTAAAAAPPDDPELNAAIYCEMGTVLQQQEQFNAAIEAGLRALKWLEGARHADPALRARLFTNLGRSAYGLGQLKRADQYFQQALDAASDAESLSRIANAHMALGVSARAVGDLERAIDHCNRALELHRRLGHQQIANRVLNNMADVHYAAGRRTEARRVQQQCLDRGRETQDQFIIGVAAGELARYALDSGNVQAALKLARESQRAAGADGDHLHQAYAAAIEAQAADRLGRRIVADRQFRTALAILLEKDAAGRLAEVCALYGDVLRRRGAVDRAFAFMRMAAERDFSKLPGLLKRA